MSQLQDQFGRRFQYLRMSVTDVCNFKCTYCLPDGYRPDGRSKFLALSEIENLVAAFSLFLFSQGWTDKYSLGYFLLRHCYEIT